MKRADVFLLPPGLSARGCPWPGADDRDGRAAPNEELQFLQIVARKGDTARHDRGISLSFRGWLGHGDGFAVVGRVCAVEDLTAAIEMDAQVRVFIRVGG